MTELMKLHHNPKSNLNLIPENGFQKGHIPWHKDTKGLKKKNKGSFEAGHIAWNKKNPSSEKTCSKCKKSFPATLEFFYKHLTHSDGLNSWCKECYKANNRVIEKLPRRKEYMLTYNKAYKKTPKAVEKRRAWQRKNKVKLRNNTLKLKYGICSEEWDRMLYAQNNCCPICNRHISEVKLVVDHDHNTGRIRGLLCISCNFSLGLFEKRQEKIINYLEGRSNV